MAEYSWQIYGPGRFAYLGGDNYDDDGSGGGGSDGGDLEAIPSYQLRKRRFQ